MRRLFVTDKCAGREGGWCGYCLLDGNGTTISFVRPHSDAVGWWGLLVTKIIKLCMDVPWMSRTAKDMETKSPNYKC